MTSVAPGSPSAVRPASLPAGSEKFGILSEQGDGTVQRIEGEDAKKYGLEVIVEKHGPRIGRSESVAMQLIQDWTDVPTPKVLDSHFLEWYGQIVMTFIPGRTLQAAWGDMTEHQREGLCRHLWILIDKMRQVPRPPEIADLALCLADGSPSDDPLVETFEDHIAPLTTDDEVRARIYERYRYFGGSKYENILRDMLLRSSRSVFTHSDIAPRNIMVDDNFNITGLLDWERAGWYPDYWELANITAPACECGDWQDWMVKTAPPTFKCDLQGINAARAVLF